LSTTLTKPERSVLAECEAVIERGQDTFIEVGNALLRIRNERLYRSEFGTFQEYCETRWMMSGTHAHRLIDAAEIAGNLKTHPGVSLTEKQIRPLARLEPAEQREAWKESVKSSSTGNPTAKEVEAVVNRIDPTRIRPISASSPSSTKSQSVTEAEKDSETLWLLKSYWKKATRAERTLFRAWLESNK
jgi:hypothetical protein